MACISKRNCCQIKYSFYFSSNSFPVLFCFILDMSILYSLVNRDHSLLVHTIFSHVKNVLSTKLAQDCTGKIWASGHFCMELAVLSPYCQALGLILSQYQPCIWLTRYLYTQVEVILFRQNLCEVSLGFW